MKMMNCKEVAKLIGTTERTVADLDKDEYIPESVKIGKRLRRWRQNDIANWISLGCPAREKFESLKIIQLKMCANCLLPGNTNIDNFTSQQKEECYELSV